MRVAERMRMAAAGQGGFTPADINNLYGWYRADDESGTDGDPLSQATDKSGNGLHLSQATAASQPLLKTGIVNGHDVYRFDGTDDFFAGSTVADWKFLTDGTGFTVFLVAFMTGANPDRLNPLLSTDSVATAAIGYDLFHDDRSSQPNEDKLRTIHTGSSGVTVNSADDALPAATWASIGARHVPGAAGDDYEQYVADVAVGTTATLSSTASDPVGALRLGATANDTFFAHIDVAELVIYNAGLSDADQTQVRDYLNSRYAL